MNNHKIKVNGHTIPIKKCKECGELHAVGEKYPAPVFFIGFICNDCYVKYCHKKRYFMRWGGSYE